MWQNFFDEIYVINLLKREDRLLQTTKDFEEYEIPFTRISAIEDENGARGLRDTMTQLFTEAIAKGYKNILVFEDDAKVVVDKIWFTMTMENIVAQLPENYHLCLLGGQPAQKFSHFFSSNLIPVNMFFSTHSVAYSLQGMKEIMSRGMGFPIDNWMIDAIQRLGHSYCTYPLLTSQHPGISDIGKNFIDWTPFIQTNYERRLAEMNHR